MLISHDGGATWQRTLVTPNARLGVPTLGWQDAQTARVSFDTNTIWTTLDAGLHWTPTIVNP